MTEQLSPTFDRQELRAWRRHHGWSQQHVARRVEWSTVHYNRVELGHCALTQKFRNTVLRVFAPYAGSTDHHAWCAEEYDCAMMVLDDHEVPRSTSVAELSLVGRIMRYGEMCADVQGSTRASKENDDAHVS